MFKDAYPWHSTWGRCKYQLVYLEGPLGQSVPVIQPIPGSEMERVDLIWRPEEGTRPPQKRTSEETGRDPHEDLALLDLTDQEAIIRFANRWGVLGLWRHPLYKNWRPLFDIASPPPPSKQPILDNGASEWFGRAGWKHWQEPLEAFQRAAWCYQQWIQRIMVFRHSSEAEDREIIESEIVYGFPVADCPYNELKDEEIVPGFQEATSEGGVRPLPIWDKQSEEWVWGWQYRSLLDAVYFATFLDMVEDKDRPGGFRRCSNEYCARIFLPSTPHQKFCSKNCEKAQNMRKYRRRAKRESID